MTRFRWKHLLLIALALAVTRGNVHVPPLATLGMLVFIAISGLAAHYFMARAFSLADTMVVMPIVFLRLPLAAFLGALLYAEPLDPFVLGGGALIVLGNLWNLVGERRGGTTA